MIPVLALSLGLMRAIAAPPAPPPGWKLVWSDEFQQPDGSAPDPAKWNYEVGGDGFGNDELEYYTNRRENSRIEGGALAIVARREDYSGSPAVGIDNVTPRLSLAERSRVPFQFAAIPRHYTSGRLTTFGKFQAKYGRVEARMKLPAGHGLWPAFWLLGADVAQVGWPDCGEIDVMESVGDPAAVYGTIHGPGYSGASSIGASYAIKPAASADGFHVFAVEWEPASVKFSVDGAVYETLTPANLPHGARWAFDKPFFIILNLAVGGDWPGAPEPSLAFPKTLLVDYVRVYQPADQPAKRPLLTDRQLRGLTPDVTF